MKNKIKKRKISETSAPEGTKNIKDNGQERKKFKKPKVNLDGLQQERKMNTNLNKPLQADNATVSEKSKKIKKKKKKKNLNIEKLSSEKSDVVLDKNNVNFNPNKMSNEKTILPDKFKEMKMKLEKREKRKQSRKEFGQFKVRETVSVEAMRQKIAEIESRENISKTAKRKLRVFKKKLQIVEGTASFSPLKISTNEDKTSKVTKSQKKKLKQRLNLQNMNEPKKEIETEIKAENIKTEKNEEKLKVSKKFNSIKKENIFVKKEDKSSDEDNEESENIKLEREDDSTEENSHLIETKKYPFKMDLRVSDVEDSDEGDEQILQQVAQQKKMEDEASEESIKSDSEDDSSGESREIMIEKKEHPTRRDLQDSDSEESDEEDEQEMERKVPMQMNDSDLEETSEKKKKGNNKNKADGLMKKSSDQTTNTKDKQQKNENRKKMLGQENSEKKQRYVLFVGNLPYQSTVEDIKKHFHQKVGNIVSVRIPTEKGTKKPRGFAYVEVTNSEDYEKALSLHHTNLGGFKIKVEYTHTGSKNIKNKQDIVVKNKKLHALRRAGKLAGSKKKNNQRNFRRKLQKSKVQEG